MTGDEETNRQGTGVGTRFVGVRHRHRFPSGKWLGPLNFVRVLNEFGIRPFKMEKMEKMVFMRQVTGLMSPFRRWSVGKWAADRRRLTVDGG